MGAIAIIGLIGNQQAQSMKFSIVTIALNAAEDLPLTIESVIQQSFVDYEYIVLDGGSWDATPSVLDLYREQINHVIRVEDAGIFSAMNDVLEFCSGEFVIFLNAKDRFYSDNVLERVAATMDASSDVVYGDHIYQNGRSHHLHKAGRFDRNFNLLESGEIDYTWHSKIPCHQATFTRTNLLRKLQYDTRLEICADHDFMFRAFASGAKFQYIDEVICHYMAGGFSALRSERLRQEFASTYRKFSRKPERVDRLFYGDSPTPFSPYTPKTGQPSNGVGPGEGPYTESGIPEKISWCSGKGFDFLSPLDHSTIGCSIDVWNVFPGQTLTVSCGDHVVGSASVIQGYGSYQIDFLRSVPAGSKLRFSASQRGLLSPDDDRFVSVAVGPFSFDGLPNSGFEGPSRAALALGDYRVGKLGIDFATMFLASGWSYVWDDHVWSVGSQSTIVVPAEGHASEICLHLAGHPYLAPEMRGVNIRVNGSHPRCVMLNTETQSVCFQLTEQNLSPNDNVIIVQLNPLQTGVAPSDSRDLGVCLLGFELR